MSDLSPGTPWGAFRIERLVGRGPAGTVYAAAASDGKPVTLKIFHDALDAATLARFEDDSRRLLGLNHPNILRVESVGREGGRRYVVTEPFDGRSLRDAGPRPLREACEIILKTARALGAAWMRLVLHRNLKPENILVSASGDVKVTDFGLAQEPTPYWSPERRSGQSADMRGDLFSLGTIFRETLGERDPEIDALIHHMTRTEPFERIQLVEDVLSRLESFLSRTAAPTVLAPPPPPPILLPEPAIFRMPEIPTAPPVPSFPSPETPVEREELREARATMVGTLGAVTKRLQRSIADRMLQVEPRPQPPPVPRTVPPPPPPPRAPVESPRGRHRSSVAPVLGTILVLVTVSGLAVYKVQARLARQREIESEARQRARDRAAEARNDEGTRPQPPSRPLPAEPARGRVDVEWVRTKTAIRALEEEMKYAEAADMCDRFVSRHGAQAPSESVTMRAELRSWSSAVQQAESFRKGSQGRRSLDLLNRGGPGRAKDRERILARWCEQDWAETVRAADKAIGESNPYAARDELDRFLKLPHQGGAHRAEAEARKHGLQAEFEFAEAVEKTDWLLRSHKGADAIAAWEAFLAQPHQGGTRRKEVEQRLAKIRDEVQRTVYAGRGIVNRLAVSPGGKRVAFTADRIRVHDVASRAEAWSQASPSLMKGLSFADDSLLVGAFSYQIRFWDVDKRAEVRLLKVTDGYVTAMVLGGGGKRLFAARSDGALLTWEGEAETPSKVEKGAATGVSVMALSPDGTKLAMGTLREKTVRVRTLATGDEKTLTATVPGVSALAWSPDGKKLAATAYETVSVWDAERAADLYVLKGHKGPVSCVAFSSDGARIAAGGTDKTIRVWSTKDGSVAGVLPGHQGRVTGLAALPGGGLLSGGADGTVRLWSLSE